MRMKWLRLVVMGVLAAGTAATVAVTPAAAASDVAPVPPAALAQAGPSTALDGSVDADLQAAATCYGYANNPFLRQGRVWASATTSCTERVPRITTTVRLYQHVPNVGWVIVAAHGGYSNNDNSNGFRTVASCGSSEKRYYFTEGRHKVQFTTGTVVKYTQSPVRLIGCRVR